MNKDPLRYFIAIIGGCVAAMLVYWLGGVVALLMLRGIPLGAAGGAPTNTELAIHLLLSALAGFVGVEVASRLSRAMPRHLAMPLGIFLGVGAIAGFGKPGSAWPAWFGVAMAIACAIGAMGAAEWKTRRG